MKSQAKEDLDGMVRHMINSLEPLPALDLTAYKNDMYYAMREFLFTSRSKTLSWQERSSGRAMTMMTELSRQYKIPMRPDVLRYIRASFQLDSVVYRLDPRLNARKAFMTYMKQRNKRSAKVMKKRGRQILTGGIGGLERVGDEIGTHARNLGAVVSFLGTHMTQLESIFRSRVTAVSLAVGNIYHGFRVLLLLGFVFLLWSWGLNHHPEWRSVQILGSAVEFCSGYEAEVIALDVPELSERSWVWITILVAILWYTARRMGNAFTTPKGILE
jgi:hypothetical protein